MRICGIREGHLGRWVGKEVIDVHAEYTEDTDVATDQGNHNAQVVVLDRTHEELRYKQKKPQYTQDELHEVGPFHAKQLFRYIGHNINAQNDSSQGDMAPYRI